MASENSPLLENDNHTQTKKQNGCLHEPHDEQPESSQEHILCKGCVSCCSRFKSFFSKWTKRQIALLFVTFSCYFTSNVIFSIILPFFPQEAKVKKSSDFEIGMIFAAQALGMFIMSPVYGILVVHLRPKFMCISGAFLCGGSSIIFGFISYANDPTTFIVLCMLCRIVEANGGAMLAVSVTSILVKEFRDDVSAVTGVYEAIGGLGFVVGPLFGSVLYSAAGYTAPFIVPGAMFFVCCPFLFILLPNIEETEYQSKNFLSLLKIPGILIIAFHCCISTLSPSFLDPIISNFMTEKLEVSLPVVTYVFAGWSLSYVIAAPVLGVICDKGYLFSMMISGLFVVGVAMFLLGPSPLLNGLFHDEKYFSLFVVSCLLLGIGTAAIYIPPTLACLNHAQVNGLEMNLSLYGMVSGLINCSYCLGSFAGPLLAGSLNDRFGFEWSTTFCGVLIIGMMFVLIVYVATMKCLGKPLRPPDVNEKSQPINGNDSVSTTTD